MYKRQNLTTRCVRNRLVASLSSCNNVDILSSCYKVVTDKLLEQLVTSLFSSTTLWQVVKSGNKQCEHILMTSCWNRISTSLQQFCYNLCSFTLCILLPPSCFRKFAHVMHASTNCISPSPPQSPPPSLLVYDRCLIHLQTYIVNSTGVVLFKHGK